MTLARPNDYNDVLTPEKPSARGGAGRGCAPGALKGSTSSRSPEGFFVACMPGEVKTSRVPADSDLQSGFLQDEGRNSFMGPSSDAAEHLRLSGEEAYARRAR